jgi:phenylpyruvate tautomerase PptA (4-oxalocrotonate tautomerase family)
MPIITIETLSDELLSTNDSLPTPDQLQSLADSLGELFGSPPSGTWVRARQQQRAYYAENMIEISPDMRPVIVEILKSDLTPGKDLALEAAAVCALVAQVLGRRTENVHVIYQPSARGRVAFGGELVR